MMKKLFTYLLPIVLVAFAVTTSYGQTGQNQQLEETYEEEFLPKYPTPSERAIIEQQIAAKAEAMLQRGPLSEAQRAAGTCEGSCGVQSAPGSCWCDNLCAQYGDCCDDYADFCLGDPVDPTDTPTPEGLIVPGEFEESQAVIVRWPYTSTSASRTRLYAEMIDAIQQEVPAWIFINNGSDSITVKNSLNFYGVTLTNYEFQVKQTNSIWARDYGPWGFYYGANDELAFIDLQYYTTRPLDNQVPSWLGNKMGVDVYTSSMYEEGGNIMFDGFGHVFYSDVLFGKNTSQNGWSTTFTRDFHSNLFNTHTATEPERLLCDGGTGHLDMYSKLLDEQTLLVSEYPDVVTASDKNRIEDNVVLFEQQITTFGGDFNIVRVPMPRRDDGSYSITCNQINADARGFVNGLLVNKTFLVPIYTNENSSQFNKDWDEAALDIIRKTMPGYNVVGIDARSLTPSGGAIHCVAMQIPTDNPVRFRHQRLTGVQPALPAYELSAEITNKSGIAQASMHWKIKNTGSWSTVPMTLSGGEFLASIPNLGFTQNDTILYYLQASTNNGKTMAKPIVAPEGYYEFYFNEDFVVPSNCDAPDGLFASNIGQSSATLNWTPVPDAGSYTIRGTVQGATVFQTVTVNNGNASSINVNILNPNTDYQWQIRTNCSNGEQSLWSAFSLFSTADCLTPDGLASSNVTSTSAQLSWNAVAGTFGYQLRGRPVGGTGYQFIEIGAGNTSINTGNQLLPNTSYEWSVRTYCNAPKTAASDWAPMATFSTGTSIGQFNGGAEEFGMTLFPNPSEGQVFATVNGASEDFAIIVRDMTGREVFKQQYPASYSGNMIELNMGNVAKGIYLVQVLCDETQAVQRLVIR